MPICSSSNRQAVRGEVSTDVPASLLCQHENGYFMLDAGAVVSLRRGRPMSFTMSLPDNREVNLTQVYATGGMAAHVLTGHGMKVFLFEAGK
jgi:hypothetical protein